MLLGVSSSLLGRAYASIGRLSRTGAAIRPTHIMPQSSTRVFIMDAAVQCAQIPPPIGNGLIGFRHRWVQVTVAQTFPSQRILWK
jgi:hypothetical protein